MEAGHFEIFASLASIIVALFRLQTIRVKKLHRENKRMLSKLLIEHEMIIEDYCERRGINREDLITRHPNVLDGDLND